MRLITRFAIYLIVCYQRFISPFTAPTCRFYPSCSQYSRESIEKHGPVKGLFYSLVRLLKCQPFHPGGYDPVK